MKEIKIMNTNTKELNLNEMEQVNGGRKKNPYKRETGEIIINWFSNTVAPNAKAVGNAVSFYGKAAINWVTGLFS